MLISKSIPCAKGKHLLLDFFFYKSGEEADLENIQFNIHSNSHTKSTGAIGKQGEQKQGKRKSTTFHSAKRLPQKN